MRLRSLGRRHRNRGGGFTYYCRPRHLAQLKFGHSPRHRESRASDDYRFDLPRRPPTPVNKIDLVLIFEIVDLRVIAAWQTFHPAVRCLLTQTHCPLAFDPDRFRRSWCSSCKRSP